MTRITIALGLAASVQAAPLLTHTDVFVSGQDGYHTFRIPALETAADGSLLAFAEGRKYKASDPGFEGQDIDLACKRGTDHGKTFANEKLIWDHYAAYSDLTVLKEKTIGILWERGQERGYQFITFTRLNLEFIEPKSK